MIDALLLDFGGVVLRTPFELVSHFAASRGLSPDTLVWGGPFDTAADPLFARVLGGSLAEREYWRLRTDELIELFNGELPDPPLHAVFEREEQDLIRPELAELIGAQQARGRAVAILTNDLSFFHPQQWIDRISILRAVDHVIDLSFTDHRKPDPRAFDLAVQTLGVAPERVLFVDDQPVNLAGALVVGMPCVLFNPANVAASMEDIGSHLES